MELTLEIADLRHLLRVLEVTHADMAARLGLSTLYFGRKLNHGGFFLDEVVEMADVLDAECGGVTTDMLLELLAKDGHPVKMRGDMVLASQVMNRAKEEKDG